MRVTVRDAATGAYVPKVQVKVIGSNNPNFLSGETDLRGVFVAEGVHGQAAAVARKGTAQYAFYRGQTPLGPPPAAQPNAPAEAKPTQTVPATQTPALDQNLKSQNFSNQSRNIERLQERYKAAPAMPGTQGGAAAGGFR